MRWPGESGGFLNCETSQRSRSARGVEPSSRPAGWRIVPSGDVREGSPRRAGERRAIHRVNRSTSPVRRLRCGEVGRDGSGL